MASHISLKQLKVFTTITQHKTLTAASDSLFLSKAAVSMALSELEKQIGHHLFDRVNNRLILNQEVKNYCHWRMNYSTEPRTSRAFSMVTKRYRANFALVPATPLATKSRPICLANFVSKRTIVLKVCSFLTPHKSATC